MAAIEVKGLNKTFDYFKKEPGLKGSFKSLFWRETLYHHAVKDGYISITPLHMDLTSYGLFETVRGWSLEG